MNTLDARVRGAAAVACALALLRSAEAQAVPERLETLAARCAPDVHPQTLRGIVNTESSSNPFAIGVVGGRLAHQPGNLAQAVATARSLEREGMNFSLGLAQVNRYNLARVGLTYATAFDPCANLRAGSLLLKDCYSRAKEQYRRAQYALRAAFSCYYSGNFTRGFRPDRPGELSYVQKVVQNSTAPSARAILVPAIESTAADPIPLVREASRRAPTPVRDPNPNWVMFADSAPEPTQHRDEPPVKARAEGPAATVQMPSQPGQSSNFVQILE